ncbi:hypothetical protein G7043_03975 [Lentzea sp. NEAU-D13]|uniref:Uncharacterized protein n=1 Tax=Lentzea alba TaxID=2714351 RepID=A0A7C9RME5_9PSEU|nr:hypothetical protein [Lentzea alba]NGY58088.1 hypothetical protein [Lentzea alba]
MTTTDALGGLPLSGWLVELLHQALLDTLMVLVLLPELMVTWTLTRLQSSTSGVVHVLGRVLQRPKLFVIALVFLFFLLWNVNTCLPGPTGCVTPVSRWTTDAGAWLDEQKVKGA